MVKGIQRRGRCGWNVKGKRCMQRGRNVVLNVVKRTPETLTFIEKRMSSDASGI